MTEFERVFFDTAPLIFFLEKSTLYYDVVKSFIGTICDMECDVVTSTITIEEYCVVPYRDNRMELIAQFNSFIQDMEMDVVSVDRTIAEKAAQIRAEYKYFKGMDALQLATACTTGCDLFFTNDKQLKQFAEIRVITIDDLVAIGVSENLTE